MSEWKDDVQWLLDHRFAGYGDQSALARELGVSRAAISCWLLGQTTPSPENQREVRRLVQAAETPPPEDASWQQNLQWLLENRFHSYGGQGALARELGISAGTVSLWCLRRRAPSDDNQRKLRRLVREN